MSNLYTKIFGDASTKTLKAMNALVEQINSFETSFGTLSDQDIQAKTASFKARLSKGETLEDILPEAFATVREAGKRTMGMRHYDVQMRGGIALHRGTIAEMRTGEGKTLTATLPVYLNALEGKGVHVVTVNDYLAKRDAVWMAKIYDFLGMTVGIVQNQRVSFVYDGSQFRVPGSRDIAGEKAEETESFHIEDEFLRPCSRQESYRCDVTYGTNNEFGFDYLRDNMVQNIEDMVMRPGNEMHYAIVDEIDSILVDEARTPLIISAPAEKATDQYYQFAELVRKLSVDTDYNIDEKLRSATLTDEGIAKFEQWLGVENMYVEAGIGTVHHIEQALKAELLFKRDKEYIVDNDEIVIIDEFTGRKMPGRRYSEGLHQAIEAKENVEIQRESQTLATITFQNLFRMYRKLAGMTGTAKTEEEEFYKIYSIDVVVLPTNKQDARVDHPDRIYRDEHAKFKAIVQKVKECRDKGQPVLLGTISVEKNEVLSQYLTSHGIPHETLNAKNHEREGEIIAQAGRPGAVTLATNMAGRGVDIKLGGNPVDPREEQQVKDAGGLFVLGTERHESRRIDNQLRGRSARQGDPGETQFFVSTDDDLMRIFVGSRLKTVMTKLNVPDDMPIEKKMITRMLENAQKKVEGFHFDTRKHLLEYDDVLNRHRDVIYKKRRTILDLAKRSSTLNDVDETIQSDENTFIVDTSERSGTVYHSTRDMVMEMINAEIEFVVSYHTNLEERSGWNLKEIYETARTIFPFSQEEREHLLHIDTHGDAGKLEDVQIRETIVIFLVEKAERAYGELEEQIMSTGKNEEDGKQMMRELERALLLRAIDTLWVEHLISIDYLRSSIGLRGYAQRDPLVEYKKETYEMFHGLLASIQKEVVYSFFKVNIGLQLAPTVMASDKLSLEGAKKDMSEQGEHIQKKERHHDGEKEGEKVGRNDACPCGSGKKYKKCHGK